MIRLTCRLCKGRGTVPNIAYEACRTMQSQEAKRYFYMNQEHDTSEENDRTNVRAFPEIVASAKFKIIARKPQVPQ